MPKKALITGVTGQDGALLTELLLSKGYEVHGVKRRASSFNSERIDHLYQDPHQSGTRLFLHYGDLTDATNLIRLVQETQPDEIYNLAAQSHVQVSFETAEYTANADGIGVLRLLEAIRILKMEERVRFYQASTSELYGKVQETPQKETTPFYPRSPYAAAIQLGFQKTLFMGNIDSLRDWGDARDYVKGMHLILQQDKPDDYVLATGEMHSVREFIELAFAEVGRVIAWRGKGIDEEGVDDKTGDVLVKIDPRYFRPTEVDLLLGDPSKARQKLGWKHEITFPRLVKEMVASDLKKLASEGPRNS